MEYKENQKFKNIALNMISEIENFCTANDKFNVCTDTIAQAVVNPLKISYIKKDKIEKLAEHASVKITDKPTTEQREKYFNACSLEKFANYFFNKTYLSSSELEDFNEIVLEAKLAANALLPKTFHIIDAEHIPQIYNHKYNNENNNNPFDIGKIKGLFVGKERNDINSSCMQGKRKEYFEIYKDINQEKSTLKMAILTQDNEIVARALVWIDKPTNEIDRRKKLPNKKVFIDRIYTKTQTNRTATQTQLYKDIHEYFNIDTSTDEKITDEEDRATYTRYANGFNWYDIKDSFNTNKEICNVVASSSIRFNVYTNKDEYDYYPYLDHLQYFDTYESHLSNDIEGDTSDTLRLDSTCGDANRIYKDCENCGNEMEEDCSSWIETADREVCDECCVWCEDRDENILTDEAVYNNNTGHYHYRDDLDI